MKLSCCGFLLLFVLTLTVKGDGTLIPGNDFFGQQTLDHPSLFAQDFGERADELAYSACCQSCLDAAIVGVRANTQVDYFTKAQNSIRQSEPMDMRADAIGSYIVYPVQSGLPDLTLTSALNEFSRFIAPSIILLAFTLAAVVAVYRPRRNYRWRR